MEPKLISEGGAGIFGKICSMSYNGCMWKFNVRAYIGFTGSLEE
jgi:hypothetical protein